MQKIKRFLFSKKFFTGIIAVFQIAWFWWITVKFYTAGVAIYLIMTFVSVAVMLYIFERDDMNPAYKIFWLMDMMLFPITGALFYALYGDTKMTRKHQKSMHRIMARANKVMQDNPRLIDTINHMDRGMGKQAYYLETRAHFPPYEDTAVKYYDMGAAYFHDMLKDLENAKETIFMQFFIIDEGYMWSRILDVLKRKVEEGVDVRLIYDGWGCIINFPAGYEEFLSQQGIKVGIFNDVKLSLHLGDYLMLNHRDHRKIVVVDSTIAYSGGINLADEYINYIERFGVWKDTGFRIEGSGVWSMTTTFLQTWELVKKERVRYNDYRPRYKMKSDGIVQPFFDTPLDKLNLCENIYLSVINNAKDYVYIATPYLIVDNEMITALTIAARSGIDVRIVVPGIPDKWYVYYVTQSYYKTLMEAGVKIYEYTPGFIHAKMYVSDDVQAIVGGANTDYRSMYLNYENCSSFYGGSMPRAVKHDFEDTFTHSRLVTQEDIKNTPLIKRILQICLRVFAPMM